MEDDIFSFSINTKKGSIFFDMKRDEKEDYLKITQSQVRRGEPFERQKLYIKKSDILLLRDSINRVIDKLSLE